jgi:restriction system protein
MLPLLEGIADGKEHDLRELRGPIAQKFGLTEGDLTELLPSGKQSVYLNRLGWAKTYLLKAGVIESPARSRVRLTKRGLDVLAKKPAAITKQFLRQFPEFLAFENSAPAAGEASQVIPAAEAAHEDDPRARFEAAYRQLRTALEDDLLAQVKQVTPSRFEQIVIDVLVAMGYGGSVRDAGQALGKSGDGGIDGVIKEDHLGLDVIYVQAKRWTDGQVGRPDVQQFAGSLQGHRARKGVFITTSTFAQTARDFVKHIDSKIALVDGKALARLMVDHGVGVSVEETVALKRIDSDYFDEV